MSTQGRIKRMSRIDGAKVAAGPAPSGLPAKRCGYGPCGADFVPVREWQDFCSDPCRLKAWKYGRITPAQLSAILARLERLEKINGIEGGL